MSLGPSYSKTSVSNYSSVHVHYTGRLTSLDRWKVDSPLNTFLALTIRLFQDLKEFRRNCVTTSCFCMGCLAYMLQRVAFVTFDISNESAEFCALSMWHVYVLATVLSFLFLWVGKKPAQTSFTLSSVTCCLPELSF